MTASRTVSISSAADPTLSPGQRKFNSLIAKIATLRKLLAEWHAGMALFRQRHANEVMPLLATYQALHVELAHLLDQRVDLKGFSRADRDTMRETVRDIAVQMMHGPHLDDMRALYDRNGDSDFEADQQRARRALKAMVEEEFGVQLGNDLDLDSPEALFQELQRKMQAGVAGQQGGDTDSHPRRGEPRPTAKQRKADAEAAQASQSVREVYRKLASTLHPDRETDAAQRERKTALMQQVNQAYAANDLLTLLQLQLDIEQITPQSMKDVAQDRLKHYNKVLATQLAELQAEVGEAEHTFRQQFNLDPEERLTPAQFPKLLARQKQVLQYDSAQLQRQLRGLATDDAYLKQWLKQRRQSASHNLEDELFAGLVNRFR